MIKQDFDKITTALETRINECEKYLANIKTTDDLANMTLKDLAALREFCKNESAVMTEIIMVDFYHIIGMGNLTAIQEAKFIKQMKKYMSFRTNMKSLASQLNTLSLDDLPEIPAKSKFKLKALCDLTLYSSKEAEADANTAFEETAEVLDYKEARDQVAANKAVEEQAQKIIINDKTRTIEINDVNYFVSTVVNNHGAKVDNVMKAIDEHKSVVGVTFITGSCAENKAKGIMSGSSQVNTIRHILKMPA